LLFALDSDFRALYDNYNYKNSKRNLKMEDAAGEHCGKEGKSKSGLKAVIW